MHTFDELILNRKRHYSVSFGQSIRNRYFMSSVQIFKDILVSDFIPNQLQCPSYQLLIDSKRFLVWRGWRLRKYAMILLNVTCLNLEFLPSNILKRFGEKYRNYLGFSRLKHINYREAARWWKTFGKSLIHFVKCITHFVVHAFIFFDWLPFMYVCVPCQLSYSISFLYLTCLVE